jgi:hypothetical protein
MARTSARRKPARSSKRSVKARPRRTPTRASGAGRAVATRDALLAPIPGTESRTIGRVRLDIGRAGAARVKRMIYPAGFRWSKDMKSIVGTDGCQHAHVGFLARGRIHIEYPDGCVVEHVAPQIVAIEPGHDGWVVGREPAVLIEFDFERDTIERLGMPSAHQHDGR